MDINNQQETLERPFIAYDGDERYIFVSYAHADRELIFPEITKFHDEGYPVWYDQGLTAGQEWDEEIEEALLGASLLIVFISKNSMASTNVVDEIKLALEEKIDVVPIYLEKTKLAKGLKLRLSNKHAIFKYNMPEKEYLYDCFKAFNKAEIPQIEFDEVLEESDDVDEVKTGDDSDFNPKDVPHSYRGNEPYIYVSYAHQDWDSVFPDIKCFNEMGYNVCYDEGLSAGFEWGDIIADKIMNSSLVVVFVSKNSMASKQVQNEIRLAVSENIEVFQIHIEETELPSGLKLRLANMHSISKYLISQKYYRAECRKAFENALHNYGENDIIERMSEATMKIQENALAEAYRREISEGRIPDEFFQRRDYIFKMKPAYVKTARDTLTALNSCDFDVVDISDDGIAVESFSDMQLDYMARCIHDLWCEDKINEGWTYGSEKNTEKLTTPYLVSWEQMPREVQQYDLDQMRDVFDIVKFADLKIVNRGSDDSGKKEDSSLKRFNIFRKRR
ncbi:TIR domain-containing protein [uncultured Methanobrevibacter sp.]|uniref:TIR domain-containing protein n=1 Tax=uncultured Methanobrevibacter sp. TaxID=253161 RepID=UPI002626C43A|nr:TIR domain-containing protein [uncultured Methanobrevibacter sp.]